MTTFLYAQDITISFQSAVSGTGIDSIWVTNLKTHQKVKLTEGESLRLTKTTGIDVYQYGLSDGSIYPNPSNGVATIDFTTLKTGKTELRLYAMSGQLLVSKNQNLAPGRHRFQVTFPGTGLYTVSVLKDDGTISLKASNMGKLLREEEFTYNESEIPVPLKNAEADKVLDYTKGNVLFYSVHSGINNTIMTDLPVVNITYSVEFYNCIDPHSNSYPVVKIGNQVWMAKNLAYLPVVNPPFENSITNPKYYVYGYGGGDVSTALAHQNFIAYGVLYNWPAAMAGSTGSDRNPSGVRGICPADWHLPSDSEWMQLELYIGMNQYDANFLGLRGTDQGTQMKTTIGWNNSGNGTNSSGFSVLPGGYFHSTLSFNEIGKIGFFWSSTQVVADIAYNRQMSQSTTKVSRYDFHKNSGFSIRCVRDF